ncbi:MAG: alpha amylase C-terminal domain-containing protein [Bacteroidales bacterium]|nr:alpha amylase C-terminal domain-containing protein [Bacteroidales bacterium]
MNIPLINADSYLEPFADRIKLRIGKAKDKEKELTKGQNLSDFANAHNIYGLHETKSFWIYKDWLPNAHSVYLVGDFSKWQAIDEFKLTKKTNGIFEIKLKKNKLKHGNLYRLYVTWKGGSGDRIPAYAKRVVQDAHTHIFNAQVWNPEKPYKQKYKSPKKKNELLIYEAHIGMASEDGKVASFSEFKNNIIPRIVKLGYNTIQLMAIQEHPYYGSFGYHVSNFFAVSSRFGTPDELKELIDEAHKNGLRVIMDIIHSHAVKNEVEGISRYDGSEYQYFHSGERGQHPAWDSRCFDYAKKEVIHFLLSNCKFWLEEYNFDGFRFDGITSMLYLNHGLDADFTSYYDYYNFNQDENAITYLTLANKLIHEVKPDAVTIAEEMSGMPGIASSIKDGGIGFDFRLAMGIPDFWIKTIKEQKDENWHVGELFFRLTDKRKDEKTINYSESHDQALVGDKTIMFRLADADMYHFMHIENINITIERALAVHKMIQLVTLATSQTSYLNFMGNEFGHPEWIDFPREGNNWSYHYARRQWNLADNTDLAYFYLNSFNTEIIHLFSNKKLLNKKIELISDKAYDQVLIFKRSNFIFVFNFNPFTSFTDYGFETEKGKYRIILNSDDEIYLGQNRINSGIVYKTVKEDKKDMLKLYIPTRTCFILENEK